MDATTTHRPGTRVAAADLIATFRHVITGLLAGEWPPESAFSDGLRIVVRQLSEVERGAFQRVDDRLVTALLPVMDALERAYSSAHSHDPERAPAFANALAELVRALRAHGVEPERPLGAEFDPHRHEAVDVRETDWAQPGTVLDMVERGWTVAGRLVRPSKVVVAKKRSETLAA